MVEIGGPFQGTLHDGKSRTVRMFEEYRKNFVTLELSPVLYIPSAGIFTLSR
ncbi:hypothetical protein NTGBS_320017 [Candidatus Nitrotoga sp. BS]|nr:hypothetical protein NTGBS_320017 [Candidatus Nitrotoga sp. BS]